MIIALRANDNLLRRMIICLRQNEGKNPPENRADFLFFNFIEIFSVKKFREGNSRAFAKTLDGYYF